MTRSFRIYVLPFSKQSDSLDQIFGKGNKVTLATIKEVVASYATPCSFHTRGQHEA